MTLGSHTERVWTDADIAAVEVGGDSAANLEILQREFLGKWRVNASEKWVFVGAGQAIAVDAGNCLNRRGYSLADGFLDDACHDRLAPVKVNSVNIEVMITVSTLLTSYHHGNLRDALLAAGLEALEGSEGRAPSLRELAREVGVSPTAVYRHFPDKLALDKALAREGLKLLGSEQSAAAEKAGGGAAGFAETGRTYVRFALAHPALFRLMFTQGQPVEDGEAPDEARALLIANTRALAKDPERAETLALQAWSIAHGIAMLMLDGRIPVDHALIDRMLDPDGLFPVHGSSSEESP